MFGRTNGRVGTKRNVSSCLALAMSAAGFPSAKLELLARVKIPVDFISTPNQISYFTFPLGRTARCSSAANERQIRFSGPMDNVGVQCADQMLISRRKCAAKRAQFEPPNFASS